MLSQEQIARMEKNRIAALNKKRANQIMSPRRQEVSFTSSNETTQTYIGITDSNHSENFRVNNGKKARVLPNWSSDTSSSSSSMPSLVYQKDILYVTTSSCAIDVVNQFQQEIETNKLKFPDSKFVLGFDIEWRVTYERNVSPRKCATIQLCSPNLCAVFQIFNFGNKPLSLLSHCLTVYSIHTYFKTKI